MSEPSGRGLPRGDVRAILAEVQPFTMVPGSAVQFALEAAVEVTRAGIAGDIVECGVWRGGCSLAMLLAQRAAFGEVVKPVHMFDSFEGLPPAKQEDGPLALEWQKDVSSPIYFENCAADDSVVRQKAGELGFVEGRDFHVTKGWFSDTLRDADARFGARRIALLRLDGDWYDSTQTCLERLMPHVSEEAPVLIDDYYAWDGCARAVHDWLSRNERSYRIRSLPDYFGAWFFKRAHRREAL